MNQTTEIHTAPCRHFGTCGGCDLQNIPYKEQLKAKELRVRELFSGFDVGVIEEIVPSPEIFHYRNKMEYALSSDNGRILAGLRQKKRFYRIVDLEECPIFSDSASGILGIFRSWALTNGIEPYHLRRHSGIIRYAAVRHSKRYNELMVIAVLSREEPSAKELVDRLKEIDTVKSVYICVNSSLSDVSVAGELKLAYGASRIKESINGIDYLIGPDSFFQTNPYCCERLYSVIRDRTKGIGGEALDMCCGTGGITLQVAKDFSKVTGVDISPKNISDAVSNAGINGIDNVEFICDDSEKYSRLKGLSAIILDPPRAGLGKKAKLCVAESGVEHVVYVSCNPANLAKDLAELGAAYSIESLIPVDMFPHTRHLEVVAILRRNRV